MTKEYKLIRVALDSLGCKLNQAETETLTQQFTEVGYRLVSPTEKADVYILNTCTVTHIADRKSRHWFRLAHRRNPEALMVAVGCYAERAPWELARIEGVHFVAGNQQKSHLLQLLEEYGYLSRPAYTGQDLQRSSHNDLRTRTMVKIQDGCNNVCSYCIVPMVRGIETSLPIEQIIDEVKHRTSNGSKEVVLTGVKVGSYSYGGINLKGLTERILAETNVIRLRFSSLQPQEIFPELMLLWNNNRLCRHFHLSLQSGSDSVLRRMRRHYSIDDYRQSITLIRTSVPEAAITTDVIVGFPGETSAEFEESYEFCREQGFARIHVFPYSPRKGTQASQMPGQVEGRIKKQRGQRMLVLAKESMQNFSRRFLEKTMPVLWEKQTNGIWSGLTDNYIRVYASGNMSLTNSLMPVKLVEIRGYGVWGRFIR